MSVLPGLQHALQGGRNGVLYASKTRFVDGVLKGLLHSRTSKLDTFVRILDDTIEHAGSLGGFSLLYKVMMSLLQRTYQSRWHPALAGFLGGALVWGNESRFTETLNLYICSRALFALAKTCTARAQLSILPKLPISPFRLWAAMAWALVMLLFEEGAPLQPSLASSMQYVFRDSDKNGREGWLPNLGNGATFVPMLSLSVAVAKLLTTCYLRPAVPCAPSRLIRRASSILTEQLLDNF
mmetsp:Transcript_13890/g.43531  ORF Transcript_13890/g.43531 Transcript_13890/m.43531 type:complete len:239 (-) Transcript_13890:484-1200(-)